LAKYCGQDQRPYPSFALTLDENCIRRVLRAAI
jgi:hypothetical protein